ncbi:MAG: DJ-1/PfpI family protein [Planctomycetaceae bacterium]
MRVSGLYRSAALVLLALCGLNGMTEAAEPKWNSLMGTIDPSMHTIAGQWTKSANELSVKAGQGARIAVATAPAGEYDFRATFTRRTGQHSIGVVVVHAGRPVVFEVDAWGSHLAGFQDIRGKSIRENATRRDDVTLENNRRYTISVEVRKGELRGLLDGKELAKHVSDGSDLSIPDVWKFSRSDQLGLVAWDCDTTFHTVELRSLDSTAIATREPAKTPAPTPVTNTPAPTTTPDKGVRPTSSEKRVLIVIANHHFFYREYADPRQELERAGIRVTVAAGRKSPCRPHDGSGQGSDGGIVQPDLALSDVKAKDFDAILFSGGWGASSYQFAFTGRYNEASYNGDRAVKVEVNRVINEFVQQNKYVCALCNGVSVLAWSRVDGKSLLAGKRVCAPVREAPAGIYNGRPAQPSCRWHPEANGAILSPAGAIGQPGNAADDVLVDGKVITGEDDPSAREMGRRIVQVLQGSGK